jgi:hypothetical protein
MHKFRIGKFYTFEFPKRKKAIEGILLDFNKDWTLIARIYDYTFDGFTIFDNTKVQPQDGEYEQFATKICKAKQYMQIEKPQISIDNLDGIFTDLAKTYQLFGIDSIDGEACDVVKYMGREKEVFIFKELTTRAKWRFELKLKEKELKYFDFDTSYLNSLKLVTSFK